MKTSLRMDYLFEKETFENQIRLAAESGIDGLEMGDMTNYDCVRAYELSEQYHVPFIAIGFYDIMNCRSGAEWKTVEESFRKTVQCAKQLKVSRLLALGPDTQGRGEDERKRFAENMKPAVELCEDQGLTLLLEPHGTKYPNPFGDFSHYFVNTSEIGFDLIDRIGSPNVKLLFDFYHVQTMEGDLLMKIRSGLSRIGHFHIAGTPQRDEPWSGEINYPNIIREIEASDYDGYLGLEYYPKDNNPETVRKVISYLKGEFCK